jgi:hypothetical protein
MRVKANRGIATLLLDRACNRRCRKAAKLPDVKFVNSDFKVGYRLLHAWTGGRAAICRSVVTLFCSFLTAGGQTFLLDDFLGNLTRALGETELNGAKRFAATCVPKRQRLVQAFKRCAVELNRFCHLDHFLRDALDNHCQIDVCRRNTRAAQSSFLAH